MEPAVLQGAPLSSGVDPGNTDPMEGFRKHQVILPIAHQDVSVMCFIFIFSLTFIFVAESSPFIRPTLIPHVLTFVHTLSFLLIFPSRETTSFRVQDFSHTVHGHSSISSMHLC